MKSQALAAYRQQIPPVIAKSEKLTLISAVSSDCNLPLAYPLRWYAGPQQALSKPEQPIKAALICIDGSGLSMPLALALQLRDREGAPLAWFDLGEIGTEPILVRTSTWALPSHSRWQCWLRRKSVAIDDRVVPHIRQIYIGLLGDG